MLLRTYFRDNVYPGSNLSSYDDEFIQSLPQLFNKYAKREHENVQIYLTEPELSGPECSADEAHLKKITCTAKVTARYQIFYDGDCVYNNRVIMGRIPYMIRASDSDLGGYFVVNGREKVIITQQISSEMPYVVKRSGADYYLKSGRSLVKLSKKSRGPIVVTKLGNALPYKGNSTGIPLAVLFMAFGVDSPQAALTFCLIDDSNTEITSALKSALNLCWKQLPKTVLDRQSALEAVAQYAGCKETGAHTVEYALSVLQWKCFPYYRDRLHLKCWALGLLVYRLISCCSGARELCNIYHCGRERYDRVGNMFKKLFRQLLTNRMHSLMSNCMERVKSCIRRGLFTVINASGERAVRPADVINADYITEAICNAVANGNILNYEGISQLYNRMNLSSQISHLTCVQRSLMKEAEKMIEHRSFDISATGFKDPFHTPEGKKCGVIQYPTLLSTFSTHSDYKQIWKAVKRCLTTCLVPIKQGYKAGADIVMLNGVWRAALNDLSAEQALQKLRAAKLQGEFPYDVRMYYCKTDRELHIWCDENCLIRPLIRLPLQPPQVYAELSWKQLIEAGYIEYVDAFEAERLTIATRPTKIVAGRHSHCEISGLAIFSYSTVTIPFAPHNPGCRLTYQDAMGKQAIPIRDVPVRGDYHQLWYGQRPLCESSINNYLGIDGRFMETGQNAVVAIICYSGYNQEDSIIMCKASKDMGMFVVFYFKHYYEEEDEAGTVKIGYHGDTGGDALGYDDKSCLQHDGLPNMGTHLKAGQAVIGVQITREGRLRESNIIVPRGCDGVVQSRKLLTVPRVSSCGKKLIQVRAASVWMRITRIPTVGDKFSSRHGQKGTVGAFRNREDMPFTADGIVPDIIINPHAIPTRMTTSQLIESLVSLLRCLTGKKYDATPLASIFDSIKAEQPELTTGDIIRDILCKELMSCEPNLLATGMDALGDTLMYCGVSGTEFRGRVFMGCVYYQRLKHMIEDKWFNRARGPLNFITFQPTDGRSKEGGIRLGEMERDCLISSGLSSLLLERLLYSSDCYSCMMCRSCGSFGAVKTASGYRCTDSRCVGDTIVWIKLPYAFKLLCQELQSSNITPRIQVKTLA